LKLLDLPKDLQDLLFDLAEVVGLKELPSELPLRCAPLSVFPDAPIGTDPGDSRDESYVQRMLYSELPPILVVDGHLIDGRHRLKAWRRQGADTVFYLDLSGIIPVPKVPYIGPLLTESQ